MYVPSLFPTRSGPGLGLATALDALSASDPKMAALIARVGPCPLTRPRRLHPFAYLLRAITYQQLSTKAAATIHGRVRALFRPLRQPTPEALLTTSSQMLRSAGLSAAKVLAVQDLARHAQAGTVPTAAQLRRMDNATIIERLTAVRGIGVWTVEMLLIFHLGRPDVLPLGDLGIRKGFGLAIATPRRPDKWGLPDPLQITRRAERWRPWRSVACWYLWRATDTPAPAVKKS